MIEEIKVELDRRCNPDIIHGTLNEAVFIESVGTAEMKEPNKELGQSYEPYARLSIRIGLAGTDQTAFIGIPVRNIEDAREKQEKFTKLIEKSAEKGKLCGIGGRSVQARVWSSEMDQRMSWKLMGKGLNADPEAIEKQELSFV